MSADHKLQLQGLSKTFGGVAAVRDASLSVASGGVHGLIGPNGAGKTTCFNMIAGLMMPDSGKVFHDSVDITGYPSWKRSHLGIARTFQNIKLLADMTVFENLYATALARAGGNQLASFLRTPGARRLEVLASEKTSAMIEELRLGAYADARATELPIGLQRRVEIARCLLTDPDVILLDEPVAGMTSEESAQIAALVRQLRGTMTVLLVEHDMSMVMSCCDMITVLDQGEVIAEGTPELIQNDERVLEAYLGRQ